MRLLLPVLLFALLATTAHAKPNLPDPLPPVAGNPADELLDVPIEDFRYDRAVECNKRTKPGVVALSEWLAANTRGVFWGSYRCEKTTAHRDHIHIGMTKPGAKGRTSFWSAR